MSDSQDFEKFYQDHFVPAMRYCTSIVKGKTDASDIVQQVFIALWKKWKELDFHTSAKAYLYKMLYNHSLNFLQKRGTRKRRETEGSKMMLDVTFNDIPAEQELHRMIEAAIDKLPEQCGIIFRMSRNEQLKYREIAAKLNISEKTVENQMGKALRNLRQFLQPYLPALVMIIHLYHEYR